MILAIPLTRCEFSASKRAVSRGRETRGLEKRRREAGVVFEGCEVDKIRLGDKKSGSTSHDPWCNGRRKRRQRLLKIASYVPKSRVEW
jgi:hypothetical protein